MSVIGSRPRRAIAAAAGATLALALLLGGCGDGQAGRVDDGGAASSSAASAAAPAMGSHVDAATFQAGIRDLGATVVDVRTPEEFAAGHLAGAVNIDVTAPDAADRFAALDPEATYAVYCRSGNRSRTALQLMAAAGIANAFGLEGGIGALAPEDLVTD